MLVFARNYDGHQGRVLQVPSGALCPVALSFDLRGNTAGQPEFLDCGAMKRSVDGSRKWAITIAPGHAMAQDSSYPPDPRTDFRQAQIEIPFNSSSQIFGEATDVDYKLTLRDSQPPKIIEAIQKFRGPFRLEIRFLTLTRVR